jgi:O-succinylbenzoic acid--CoA ligase
VRAVVVGGGALDEAVGEAARALGWPVLASFGMTEAGSQVATAGLSQLGERFAAGRLPLLGPWDARVDVDGRLALRGTPLFSGYVVAAGAGWEFLPRTGDWFQTSDHVALDGRLVTPLGRADRRVKVLGELVDLDEIHRALGKFIAPGGWSVVDLPDPRRGARIVLVTESAPPGPEMLADIAAYQAQAPGPERLAATAVVPEFPRSALGKLRVAELRRIAAGCANNL